MRADERGCARRRRRASAFGRIERGRGAAALRTRRARARLPTARFTAVGRAPRDAPRPPCAPGASCAACARRARRRTRRPRPARARRAPRASRIASMRSSTSVQSRKRSASRQRALVEHAHARRAATRSSAASAPAPRPGATRLQSGSADRGIRAVDERLGARVHAVDPEVAFGVVVRQDPELLLADRLEHLAGDALRAASRCSMSGCNAARSPHRGIGDRLASQAPGRLRALSAIACCTHPGHSTETFTCGAIIASSWCSVSEMRDHRVLARVVRTHERRGDEPRDRRGVHDVRFGLLHQQRHERAHAVDHAPQVDADHPLPRRERHLPRQAAAAHARVVAEARARRRSARPRRRPAPASARVGHVGDDALDLRARGLELADGLARARRPRCRR